GRFGRVTVHARAGGAEHAPTHIAVERHAGVFRLGIGLSPLLLCAPCRRQPRIERIINRPWSEMPPPRASPFFVGCGRYSSGTGRCGKRMVLGSYAGVSGVSSLSTKSGALIEAPTDSG